jgi:integrase
MPLKVTRRKSTGALTISGTVAGQRVQRRAQSDRVALADEEAAALEAELLRTEWHGERRGVRTFAEAVVSYLEAAPRRESTKRRLRRVREALGVVKLSEVDQDAVTRLQASLCPGAAPATILREIITPLRSVLRHAKRRGWCDTVYFETSKQPQGRTLFMMPDEAERLIEAAAPHLKPLLVFLLGTGARLSEAIYLEWRDVDLTGGRVIFWETKNGTRRVAHLPSRVCLSLATMSRVAERHVFLTPSGEPYADKPDGQSGGQIKTAWRGAIRRAGLNPEFTPHTCRHTWASWHYAIHRDLLKLKVEGGWLSTALVERYAHLMPAGYEQAIKEFWDGSLSLPAGMRASATIR